MLPPTPVPSSAEFGAVEALEIRRLTRHGALRPVLCPCDDGAIYVVKPFSSGGAWPQITEWVCARLGRIMGLPIPNYRQVLISPELADAATATAGRFIEAGVAFGSQQISGAVECDPELTAKVMPADATQVLAFDWWIRNSDRIRSNPNLLWSHDTDQHYLIDHEKAGSHEDSAAFWHDHLFAGSETWMTAEIHARMKAALPHIPDIVAEMPPEWTSSTRGLDWFVTQLTNRIEGTPHKEWRAHEEPTAG